MESLKLPKRLYAAGEVQVRSNGEGSKTAPVTIIASSGQPFEYPDVIEGWDGLFVWDHASVKLPHSKIPLDWEHDESWSIGWLSKMEASDTAIQVSGAIVRSPADNSVQLIDSIEAGTPFQASCESHSYTLEIVPIGASVFVNGRDLVGPLIVCRDWELTSVAICKYGKDDDTTVSLAASKRKKAQAEKVLYIRSTNKEHAMTNEINTTVEAAKTEEAAKVEETNTAKVETPETEVVETVEANATTEEVKAEATAEAEATTEDATPATEAVKADPRAEFKKFVEIFGPEKASEYYAADMELAEATMAHIKFLTATKSELTKKLAASKSSDGLAAPIVFGDSGKDVKAKKTMGDIVSMPYDRRK